MKVWCISERRDSLERLINQLKFGRSKATAKTLAILLDDTLPLLPPSTCIVPIPTARSHIRTRGYDHMKLIALHFAKRRSLRMVPVLSRTHEYSQKGANQSQRNNQARLAYRVTQGLSKNQPYLILDDVITTGATIRYAAKAMQQAGAQKIWVGAISHEPLD